MAEGEEVQRSSERKPPTCPHLSSRFRVILQSAPTGGTRIPASPKMKGLFPEAAHLCTLLARQGSAVALSHNDSCQMYHFGTRVLCLRRDSVPMEDCFKIWEQFSCKQHSKKTSRGSAARDSILLCKNSPGEVISSSDFSDPLVITKFIKTPEENSVLPKAI